VPIKLSGTAGAIRTPPPRLGQHTDEVLRSALGLSDAEIGSLRAQEAI
jgi:crotonobetainyl-CoA:carnitine CoA-transferase CaiB-like acyl-CoA transferase